MYNEALKTFITVADCGSFTKAADKLYISATAVMKQMNMLESRLGMELFARTTRGTRLTASGESIYRDAKDIVELSDKAVERARQLTDCSEYTVCIGTSMLNPCKVFMDLWCKVSDKFPKYKLHVIPFEDDRNGILTEIDALGEKYDFLVGACDSREWLARCNFQPLGSYKMCAAVPSDHPLASKKALDISDLCGSTVVMTARGDSPNNDALRSETERLHPQIKVEDTCYFYDIEVFNNCVRDGKILMTLECWKDIHPSMVTIPINGNHAVPYGILYSTSAPDDIIDLVGEISKQ